MDRRSVEIIKGILICNIIQFPGTMLSKKKYPGPLKRDDAAVCAKDVSPCPAGPCRQAIFIRSLSGSGPFYSKMGVLRP